MKVPGSVRTLFTELRSKYSLLGERVDALVANHKERRWHYESRLKNEESFALKLETGRESDPSNPEDFFACTLVVENQGRVFAAEQLVKKLFEVIARRPSSSERTPLPAHSFDFDDLRLYVAWRDDPTVRPSGLAGLKFEFQIKTFLQHAWAIATHDLVYKTDDVNWATSRIAYQVKAALENAELSIAEARRLTDAVCLKKEDSESLDLKAIIAELKERWQGDQLPRDLRRLAKNISDLSRLLALSVDDIWMCLDRASAGGGGTKTLNLSPFASIVDALIRERGAALFDGLRKKKKGRVFIPLEIDLPELPPEVAERIIRPPRI